MFSLYLKCLIDGEVRWEKMRDIFSKGYSLLDKREIIITAPETIIRFILRDPLYFNKFDINIYRTGIYLINVFGIQYLYTVMNEIFCHPDFPRNTQLAPVTSSGNTDTDFDEYDYRDNFGGFYGH